MIFCLTRGKTEKDNEIALTVGSTTLTGVGNGKLGLIAKTGNEKRLNNNEYVFNLKGKTINNIDYGGRKQNDK